MLSLHNVLQTSFMFLLLHYLLVEVSTAPLAEFSGEYGYLSADQTFQQFLTNNLEFSHKIKAKSQELRDIFCKQFHLCKEEELTMVKEQLGLLAVPLDQCHSTNYNVENCFNQIRSGLKTYHTSFAVLEKVLTGSALAVSRLQHDIEDLETNFRQQMEHLSIVVVNYPPAEGQQLNFPSPFHEQAGGYLILCDLQHSLETVIRALRFLQRL